MNISVIGLGKLGLPFAFFIASYNNKVLAFDKNPNISKLITKKKNNIVEPELKKYIKKFNKRVEFKNSLEETIKNTDITFLVLPTPSLKNGSFSNKYIEKILIKIAKIIKHEKKKHFINITSTVNPNSCKKIFIPLLEKNGLTNNKDFSIIYNPHFIAQGTTLYNLRKPDVLLIGTDNLESTNKIISLYKKIYKKKKIYKILNLTEAEITKIAINSYITNKISFANYISEISENLNNVNAVNILDAIGQDTRIGKSYLKLGTKFSGPCFPRDNKALASFSKKIGVKSYLPTSVDKINNLQSNRIIKKIKILKNNFKERINIGILGITYKPDTDIILDSQSYDLIKKIDKKKLKVHRINYYDKYVRRKNYKIGKNKIYSKKSLKQLVNCSDIILIMYNDKEFYKINRIKLKKTKAIVDCWNTINNLKRSFIYSQLGMNN